MNLDTTIDEYCTQLRRRQIEGSLPCARRTAEILRLIVTTQRYPDAAGLIQNVRDVGCRMQRASPVQLAIGNMIRRVLHIIREEQQQEEEEEISSSSPDPAVRSQAGLLSQAFRAGVAKMSRAVSLSNLLDQGLHVRLGEADDAASTVDDGDTESVAAGRRRSKGIPQWRNKHNVIEMINELIDELDNIGPQIAGQAVEHIHANEVILTYGMSDTTYYFLREASKKREFQVVVAEGAPRCERLGCIYMLPLSGAVEGCMSHRLM